MGLGFFSLVLKVLSFLDANSLAIYVWSGFKTKENEKHRKPAARGYPL